MAPFTKWPKGCRTCKTQDKINSYTNTAYNIKIWIKVVFNMCHTIHESQFLYQTVIANAEYGTVKCY